MRFRAYKQTTGKRSEPCWSLRFFIRGSIRFFIRGFIRFFTRGLIRGAFWKGGRAMFHKVRSVTPISDFSLLVEFENGST